MTDDISIILEETTNSMKKAMSHFESELSKIRAVRLHPQCLMALQ